MYKFQIVKTKESQFHVRFMYNGEIIFTTETYTRKEAALNAIRAIMENASKSEVEEIIID